MPHSVTLVSKTGIPFFARNSSHPPVTLDDQPAIARSAGQGRPQAGACAVPLSEASSVAVRSRFRGGSWRAVLQSIVVATAITMSLPLAAAAQSAGGVQSAVRHAHAAYIAEASQRFGIPEAWIIAVMRAESAGDPRAVSAAGAMGLMQIMPDTWDELRARHRLGHDPFDLRDNIMAGAAYLREMWDRYGNLNSMLAAYNAGPGRYDEYLSAGRQLPAETRAYVAALAPILNGDPAPAVAGSATAAPTDWRDSPLFVARLANNSDAQSVQSDGTANDNPMAASPRGDAIDPAHADAIFVPLSGEGARP